MDMHKNISNDLLEYLDNAKVVVAPKITTLKSVPYLMEALQEGGVRCVEITLRTPIALDVMKLIIKRFPEMKVMAGTIIEYDQVAQVQDIGAMIGVAPGIQPKILERALELNFPFAPGIATPSEIAIGLEYGCQLFKFFPADLIGGIPYLKRIYASYAHKGIQFIPLGGINATNLEDYLAEASVLCVGGTWIADKYLIDTENWKQITDNACAALRL